MGLQALLQGPWEPWGALEAARTRYWLGCVHTSTHLVIRLHLGVGAGVAQIGHATARLRLVPAGGVHELLQRVLRERVGGVLTGLHLAVHHAGVLALARDVVHLRGVPGKPEPTVRAQPSKVGFFLERNPCRYPPVLGDGRVEDVVQVHGEQREEAGAASVRGGVARVVRGGPCVGATRETAVGQRVQHALVGIVF